jgi:mono/diheme cytochrome c family protein
MPRDRQGWWKPACDRAAVSHPALKYPVEDLQESLAEGIMTGHPTMPEFRLEPDQINDVISYLKTLER